MADNLTDGARSPTETSDQARADFQGALGQQEIPQPEARRSWRDLWGLHHEDAERSYVVRCAPASNGSWELTIEGSFDLDVVLRFQVDRANSSVTEQMKTEYTVLLIQSRATWHLMLDRLQVAAPGLHSMLSPFRYIPRSVFESSVTDLHDDAFHLSHRTWLEKSPESSSRTFIGQANADPSALQLNWDQDNTDVPLDAQILVFGHSEMTVRIETADARLQGVLAVEMPHILLLYHETDPHYQSMWRNARVEQELFQRLLQKIEQMNRSEINSSNLPKMVMRELHRIIVDQERSVLDELECSIVQIDRCMAYDKLMRILLRRWRWLMSRWRPYLHSIYAQQRTYVSMIDKVNSKAQRSEQFQNHWLQDDSTKEEFALLISELQCKTKAILEHCESTFTTLMTTMSLIESEKAINQAEEVTKLTQLAFFFIPLTFVAGIYGMNLGAFSPHVPSTWSWAITSVGLSVLTYCFLYYRSILVYLQTKFARRKMLRQAKQAKV